MKKKSHALVIIILLIFAAGIVLILSLSNTEKPNFQHNSFSRKFHNGIIISKKAMDIKYNSYYIAGVTPANIYLGNVTNPWQVLITNTDFENLQHVELRTESDNNLDFYSITVRIDSPYFYFVDNTIHAIFKGKVGEWYGYQQNYNRIPFIESIPRDNKTFFIRTIRRSTKTFALGIQMNTPPYVRLDSNLLEKQIDGKFCTDGMLHFNKELNMLVYVYYYRNQFICADTNLSLIYKGNTIDTISHAKITVARIKSDNSLTLSSPPLLVNRKSSVSGQWLFINSNLLSKNEDKKMFESSSVIDVYDLKSGQYQLSFYLPKYLGNKLREFKVFNSFIISLYDQHILKYELDLNFLR